MSCGVGHRSGSDLALLLLWCRPAATAPIWPLAWEPPYATGVALEKTERTNEKKNQPPDWDKTFATDATDKGLILKYTNSSYNTT